MHKAALILIALLAGCADPPRPRTKAEIELIANKAAERYARIVLEDSGLANDAIQELRRENQQQEREISALRRELDSLNTAHSRLLGILAEYEKEGRFN